LNQKTGFESVLQQIQYLKVLQMDEIFGKIQISQTLSQKIEHKIEDAILQNKLVQGAKLPSERELCESFAVSRTALREALRRLNARGLIAVRKGSGMVVTEINNVVKKS
jgi:GntR family transcriptional repressor for pyruvate dehydrogenase complex